MLTKAALKKPKDNKCTTCRIDLGTGYMIFYPDLCMSCVLDVHIKDSTLRAEEKELKWKQELLMDTFKNVNNK